MADEEEIASLAIKLGLKADKHEFEEGNEFLKKLQEGLEYFAGFEAVKGLFELVEHQTEAAVGAKHLAEQLNISIESVQELGYAADVTGGSTENMRVSLQHLAFAAQQASKTGTGPLIDGLQKLHIPLSNIKKEKLDANLEEIAEGFKNAGPEINKTALAIELFGRKGTTLIPLLNKGKEGIQELRREFVEIGNETTAEQAEQLEHLEEAQKKVKYLWEGIKFDAVMAILPTLQELVETFFNWVKANRELIASSLVNMMHALAKAFAILGTVAGAFVEVLNFISKDGDAVTAILIAIGSAIAFVAGKALLAWAAGNLMMLGWGTLIAGVIFLVVKLIEHFDDIIELVHKVGEAIKSAFEAAFDFVRNLPVIKQLFDLVDKLNDLRGSGQMKATGAVGEKEQVRENDKFFTDEYSDPETTAAFRKGEAEFDLESDKARAQREQDLKQYGPHAELSPSDKKGGGDNSGKGDVQASLVIEQHIHPTPGMSEQDVADISKDAIKDTLQEWVRTNYSGAGIG